MVGGRKENHMDLPNYALLAAWLKVNHMKAGAFAEFIPVSKDVISHILNGRRKPKQEIADKIERLTAGTIRADKW